MRNWKNTIPKHIFENKTINLNQSIRKNKNSPKESKEREREREYSVFVWEKYELNERNDIIFIQNKMGRRRVKL